jgi:hypothetical protein
VCEGVKGPLTAPNITRKVRDMADDNRDRQDQTGSLDEDGPQLSIEDCQRIMMDLLTDHESLTKEQLFHAMEAIEDNYVGAMVDMAIWTAWREGSVSISFDFDADEIMVRRAA